MILDTHLLIWALTTPARLGADLAADVEAARDVWFSAAAILEVAIKHAQGRPDFTIDPTLMRRQLLRDGWRELAVDGRHAAAAAALPPLHGDPFDRLMAAQAGVEGRDLLTRDRRLAAYPGPIRLV